MNFQKTDRNPLRRVWRVYGGRLTRAPSWIMRALLLGWLLSWPVAPGLLVMVGGPQTVQTSHPLVCAHTRLTDEVEPWKIRRTLELVREMGASTVVEYFPWAYIEPTANSYNWAHSDLVIEHARAQGLTVVARLGLVPLWARPEAGGATPLDTDLDPAHYSDFAAFVGAFVARYRGQVEHVIIWNEPNLALEWGYQQVNAGDYVKLLAGAYAAAKAANPDVIVLGGALAPTLEPQGSPNGTNDLIFLQQLYDAGFADVYDMLAVHAYGLGFPPAEPPAANAVTFRRVELVREVMIANGDGDKQIMITESGWNDSPRWTRAVRPAARIDYTLGSYRWAEDHWPYVTKVCTWAFRYPAPSHSYRDYYTFVTPEFIEKPIYRAVQVWARGLEE